LADALAVERVLLPDFAFGVLVLLRDVPVVARLVERVERVGDLYARVERELLLAVVALRDEPTARPDLAFTVRSVRFMFL